MPHRGIVVALIAGGLIALPAALSAQQATPAAKAKAKQQRTPEPDYDIEELTPGQIQRAQEREQREQRPRRPAAPGSSAPETMATPAPASKAAPAPAGRAVACSGVFAKDTTHLKLATVFAAQNVTFTDVEVSEYAKVMATVLFPKDPKRRLEVWWQNEAARSGIYLIVINGQSAWSTPKGLRLGLGLAAIEKLNGKPFKLKGFDKDGGSVSDWQEGALASLPGGCKVGARLAPSPKAPQAAREEVASTREFLSTDATMRAAAPAIAEIILGY